MAAMTANLSGLAARLAADLVLAGGVAGLLASMPPTSEQLAANLATRDLVLAASYVLDLTLSTSAVLGGQEDARRAALSLVARMRRLGVAARRRRTRARVGAREVAAAGNGRVDDRTAAVADELGVRGKEDGVSSKRNQGEDKDRGKRDKADLVV